MSAAIWNTLLCVLTAQFAPPPSNLELANLPEAVSITAEATTEGRPEPIAFRYELESSWDWVRFEQWELPDTGDARMIIEILDTWEEELYYQVGVERASRIRRLATVGDTAGEFGITPICVLRMMAVAEAQGNTVHESRNGDRVVYSFTGERLPKLIEVEIDTKSKQVVRCYRGGKTRTDGQWCETTYEDWIGLPDGTHHPTRVIQRFRGGPAGDFDHVSRLTDIRLLDALRGYSEFTLPEHVLIEDSETGELRNQRGELVAEPPASSTPSPPVAKRPFRADPRKLLLYAGIGVLVLAGVIWLLKRRGVVA